MEDRHLLEAWSRYVATNDEATFIEVYDALYGDTLYFAISKCKNTHFEAEDIVAVVWEKLLTKKPLIESNIRGYIFRMVKHTFLDLLKKNNKIVSGEIPEDAVSESMKLVFLDKEDRQQRDLENKQCLGEKDYDFIMQFADLIGNRHTRKEAHKQLARIFNLSLSRVGNRRTSIMKKLKACRANRANK